MASKRDAVTALARVIEGNIHLVRGTRVMLDVDLAELYGVETRVLNQAVERNPERFPADFAFQLTEQEFSDLRAQLAPSKEGRGGRRYRPRVFTEHGVAMLSGVLKSETAVRVNVEIIRAFVRMRRLFATPGELVAQLQKLVETVQVHDDQLRVITDVLRKMMEPPPVETPKRRIGFVNTDSPEDDKK